MVCRIKIYFRYAKLWLKYLKIIQINILQAKKYTNSKRQRKYNNQYMVVFYELA
jgi:hypothetical protein